MRMKKTLAVAVMAAMALALTACGGDDAEGGEADGGGPETADIRVWLNGPDTPQDARDWLKETFEEQNPGSTLTIEEQQWEGLVERLTTALSSDSETPDVVEVGNTQAPTFTSAGAFSDVTDDLADWGGDDLLPGFVEGATVDGQTYAVPYYAGSKYIFYRKDLFEKAGLAVPTTMDEFVDAAVALKQANPKPANFSGFWFPGQDWRNGAAFIWNAGGDLAVQDGDAWVGNLSAPESVAGPRDRPAAVRAGLGCAEGRQRGRPADAVLQRRDRHDVHARLGHRPDQRPRDRLPRHDEERRRLRAPGLRRCARRRCCWVARTSRSRPSPPTRTWRARRSR